MYRNGDLPMSRRRCCCDGRPSCQYFVDSFEQGPEGGPPSNDWVSDGGTWTLEEPQIPPTTELHEVGTANAILMCQERHPVGSSTVQINCEIEPPDTIGESPGVIFDARIDDDGRPIDYSYVRLVFDGPSVIAGSQGNYTVYGRIQFGTKNGGVFHEVNYQTNPPDGIDNALTIIVDPLEQGEVQISARWETATKDFTAACYIPRGGAYCGLANFGTEKVIFKGVNLREVCETNRPSAFLCTPNDCTIDQDCVPKDLIATISSCSCREENWCNTTNCGADDGGEFTLTYQKFGVQESFGAGVFNPKYIWQGSYTFEGCPEDNPLGTRTRQFALACDPATPTLPCPTEDVDCDQWMIRLTDNNIFLDSAILDSCSNHPVILEFSGMQINFLSLHPDWPTDPRFGCGVDFSLTITEA